MIRVLLIANAGILLEIDGIRFLIDGLHHSTEYPFSMVPEYLLDAMNEGDNIFRSVDFVIFTHDHPDHYSPYCLYSYLHHNSVRRVILPAISNKTPEEDQLAAYMEERHIPSWRVGLPRGKYHSYQLMPEVYLTALGMKHTGEMFADRNCDCLMLTVRGKNVLITSDCDYTQVEEFALFNGADIDAVFVNPMFFHAGDGQQLLKKWNSKNVVLYHIPFAHEDKILLRSLAHQDYMKHAVEYGNLHLLWNPEQVICIE